MTLRSVGAALAAALLTRGGGKPRPYAWGERPA
jgi:hypothetical protein